MIVHGSVAVPGDKSLTHRLLLLAGLTSGRSRLRGALTSLDARSTARILRGLGIGVSSLRPNADVVVHGRTRFKRPTNTLHCGNSGTTARLSLGLLAAHSFAARLTGDNSLRRRPMRRVTEPLAQMGAQFGPVDPSTLPLTIRGGPLRPLEWQLPVSSAQIKGCLLFAGMAGGVPVSLREPGGRSRDHTERLLRAFGYAVVEDATGWLHFSPSGALVPFDLTIPGDPSSAAFLLGTALLAEGGSLRVRGVGLNPTRTGFLRVLDRMGAKVTESSGGESCGEPVGDLEVVPGPLRATSVLAEEIPGLIDEVPVLAVLASRALGESRFHEVGELRVKESDRLGLLAANLRAIGSRAAVEGNALVVAGGAAPPAGRVHTAGDHRIAMAFATLRAVPGARVHIDDMACAEVSFPGFAATLHSLLRRKGSLRG
ncbi:MAG TPA: 3-phosphoshikimate 1-carboxyvinyltransferase [Gemmatimonadales bacterium]|jgi:3-phosphoshikimate 1-carboxyvinyltransferase|nr:3-phosphoshikimate 1-carboxyvinyltransferase [Gemmatimonadales bacterium]